MEGALLLLFIAFIVVGFLYLTQAPPSTGVSSYTGRREKKEIRVTLLHCWLFPNEHDRLFRYCSIQDGCLLLTQAMQPLLGRVPVEHYKAYMEETGQHPRLEPVQGQTDLTLSVTFGARALTAHRQQCSRDQAEYWLLCQCYAAITKQQLTPILVRKPVLVPAPAIHEEEPIYAQLTTFLSPNAEEEEEEEEQLAPVIPAGQTLNDCLRLQQKWAFMELLMKKMRVIVDIAEQEGRITQGLLMGTDKILNSPEWRFLFNRDEGILWELGIVVQNERYETIITKDIHEIALLLEAWVEQQAW